ncbi:prefoldin subunit 5-like protein [Leptotrombidium deliense]|uniref:Prefoldin subunit 5-like protein n=1 Tax=Leptotrombidium deliense TaxID=299467 RepID=A0A443STE7_9ACAR|nr:prefoldin subunit 5-like protein [Leptotrombidium deliense]
MASKTKKTEIAPEMSLQQLSIAKQQFDQEIELLANSVQQLQAARSKYEDSEECVTSQKSISMNTELLVPLTGSMYVLGRVKDANTFIVDIGAGYFVEKNGKDATDYFKRKVKFLNEKIEKYAKLLQEKVHMREKIMMALSETSLH